MALVALMRRILGGAVLEEQMEPLAAALAFLANLGLMPIILHGAGPLLVDIEGPFAAAAMGAMEDVWGKPPVKVREGGSIPIVGTLNEVLGAPTLLMGFGLSDDRLHSPNEKFHLDNFWRGIRTSAILMTEAAK